MCLWVCVLPCWVGSTCAHRWSLILVLQRWSLKTGVLEHKYNHVLLCVSALCMYRDSYCVRQSFFSLCEKLATCWCMFNECMCCWHSDACTLHTDSCTTLRTVTPSRHYHPIVMHLSTLSYGLTNLLPLKIDWTKNRHYRHWMIGCILIDHDLCFLEFIGWKSSQICQHCVWCMGGL